MAIDSVDNLPQSRRIAFVWAIPAFFGAMIIGLVGVHLVSAGVLPALSDSEFLMPTMAKTLLPTWLAGIFISGAIAAMMSTADSQLLISTTVLTQDIYNRFSGLKTDEKTLLTIGRLLTIIIGVIGFGLAWQSKELVFEMVSYAWGGLGASFGPALLLTLWWRKTSTAGVLAGMISGTLFTIWDIAGGTVTPRLTAFLIAFLAVVVLSYLMPNDKE
jgi:sodium/proline symporter